MNLAAILILAVLCYLARELRRFRRDTANVEVALADLHIELRGRLMVLDSMLSRQPVGDGDHALIAAGVEDEIEQSNGKGDPRWN